MNECKCDNCKHCFEEKKENKESEILLFLRCKQAGIYSSKQTSFLYAGKMQKV